MFTGNCNECGEPGHSAKACPKLGKGFGGKCDGCGKVGHQKRLCPFQPGLRSLEEGDDADEEEEVRKGWENMDSWLPIC